MVNLTLSSPSYLSKVMFETDRQMLTRFRCGSHSLKIETGRYNGTKRIDRMCSCGIGIQSILHCFTECPLTLPLLQKRYNDLQEIFQDEDICRILQNICKVLKIAV